MSSSSAWLVRQNQMFVKGYKGQRSEIDTVKYCTSFFTQMILGRKELQEGKNKHEA